MIVGDVQNLTRRPDPALICHCGHMNAEHKLAGDDVTRKACQTSSGSGGALCGCVRFQLKLRRYVVVGFVDEPV